MPKAFLDCVKKVDKDRYMHICYLDGKAYPGEVLYKK